MPLPESPRRTAPSYAWLSWACTALAAGSLLLVIADVVLASSNRAVQAEANQRQQFINQSLQLGRVNETLIRALAVASVNANDAKLHDMLVEQGITITTAPPTATPPAAPATTR